MNRRPRAWRLLAALLAAMLAACAPSAAAPTAAPSPLSGLPVAAGRFTVADGPRPLRFPADLGPHNDFQTEWWYYTGNLATADGRRFGFQLTFFRRALLGPAEQAARASPWATAQVYLGHFTVSDIAGGQFHAFERFERGAAGLAGAQGTPQYSVWLDDWSVQQTGPNTYQLSAAQDGVSLHLALTDRKGFILQGDQGYSQKGPNPSQASYYVSQTRLEALGTMALGGQAYTVRGTSWMDHEFSTSALEAGQVGWDWFSMQLDDGTEIMAYTLRRKDGRLDAYSRGTVIGADGATQPLNKDGFQVQAAGTWQSPHSGTVYPAGWTFTLPAAGLTLHLRPLLADQELNLSFTYWEGAVQIEGSRNGVPLHGQGYVELTGYGQSLAGQF